MQNIIVYYAKDQRQPEQFLNLLVLDVGRPVRKTKDLVGPKTSLSSRAEPEISLHPFPMPCNLFLFLKVSSPY